ncbi:hypothetical protein ES705_27750 [subsurface metagenome]
MAEFLLKLVLALTPLGVKEMKRCGCGEQVEGLIDVLAKLTVSAVSAELTETQYGETDNRAWPKVWARLAELRAALREG